tara:strand:+ start:50 stop:463 length:414 start_codon:yes stop_codon:yes gene_type:complete
MKKLLLLLVLLISQFTFSQSIQYDIVDISDGTPNASLFGKVKLPPGNTITFNTESVRAVINAGGLGMGADQTLKVTSVEETDEGIKYNLEIGQGVVEIYYLLIKEKKKIFADNFIKMATGMTLKVRYELENETILED